MRPTAIILFLLFAAAESFAQSQPAYRIEPRPSWVVEHEVPRGRSAHAPETLAGAESLLRDEQILVTDGVARYARHVARLESTAGVQSWQEIEIDFDPTFQTLILHHVTLRRDGQTIDALRPDEIRVIQRETDLAQRIYDGRMTALMFVHDLRPGDVIDYAWTIEGSNPILGGRFADLSMLSGGDATARLEWRLLHAPDRPLQTKVFDSPATIRTTNRTDGLIEKRITLQALPALTLEEYVPMWLNPIPRVQTSEFDSWSEVAEWASTLFASAMSGNDRDSLQRTVRMIASRGETDEDRAVAAIRFVQDEIRYLGIEAGPNSHTPHPPSVVLTRRFGDCKDKALLLVYLLRELGVESSMALVDSGGGRELDSVLPSPFVFDHVIVRVKHDGRDAWVDATISDTGGSLSNLATPELEKALLVEPGTTSLASLPAARAASTHVVERWTIEKSGSARFDVESRYTGSDADQIRSYYSSISRQELGEQYRDYYAQVDADIRLESLPEIDDDRAANVVRVSESYVVDEFWSANQRELWAHVIGSRLLIPSSRKRSLPLAIPAGNRVVHDIEVTGDGRLSFARIDRIVESKAFRLHAKSWKDGDRYRWRWEWNPRADAVAPADLAGYLAAAGDAENLLSVTISRGSLALAGLGSVGTALPSILTGGAAAATGFLLIGGITAQRMRKRRRRRMHVVSCTAEIGRLANARHCGLDGIPVPGTGTTAGQDETGSPVVRMAVVCPQCHRVRTLTVAIRFGSPEALENQPPQSSVNTGG